jgi:hypothetical protein
LLAAYTHEVTPTAHDYLVQDQPLAEMRAFYEEGYDLALDLLETLGLPGDQAQSIDAAQLLQDLGISVSLMEMDDAELRSPDPTCSRRSW